MKFSRVTASFLALLFFFSVPVYSQNPAFKQKIKKFKNSRRFFVKYDKFKNETTITAGPFSLTGTMEYMMTDTMIFLYSGFRFEGENITTPVDAFYLGFSYSGREWQFLKNTDVYALVDGERMHLGEADRDSDVHLGGVEEMLAIKLDQATFSKIAKAKSVELKVGEREFKLKEEHLQSFRDLISLSQP